MSNGKQKNPAFGFLLMAGFNALAAVVFVIFYFLYDNAQGESSYLLLLAGGIAFLAAVALVVLYQKFQHKLKDL